MAGMKRRVEAMYSGGSDAQYFGDIFMTSSANCGSMWPSVSAMVFAAFLGSFLRWFDSSSCADMNIFRVSDLSCSVLASMP